MGESGVNASQQAAETSGWVVQSLASLGDVPEKKMFGGSGILENSTIFPLVNSGGELFLKVDDTNRSRFNDAAAKAHGRMPTFQVPSEVGEDPETLLDWIAVSKKIGQTAKEI